jgi:hypothetical protein
MEMKKVPRIVGLKGNGNIFSKYALILTFGNNGFK